MSILLCVSRAFKRYMTCLYTPTPSLLHAWDMSTSSLHIWISRQNDVTSALLKYQSCLDDVTSACVQGNCQLLVTSKWRKYNFDWSCENNRNIVLQTDRLFPNINPVSRISRYSPIYPCNFRYNCCQNQGRDVDQTKSQKSLVKLIVWCLIVLELFAENHSVKWVHQL